MPAAPAVDVNFALQLPAGAQDISTTLIATTPLRPGFEATFAVVYRNHVPAVVDNVELRMHYDPAQLEPGSSMPAGQNPNPGELVWMLGSLGPNESGTILLYATVPATVALDTTVCLDVQLTPAAGDLAPADNTARGCYTVVGSFDPNDKIASPPDQVLPGMPVHYTVRFQNTGTYPAAFVRIIDTIRTEFDLATLDVLAASHAFSWTLKSPGIIEFFFENIQLPPESVDEPGSHGFVHYAITPRLLLAPGTALRNTAHIFFDYNEPIVTNTTQTWLTQPNATSIPAGALRLKIHPTPASTTVRIDTNAETGWLSIYDATGRRVYNAPHAGVPLDLDVRIWAPGSYRVVFRGNKILQGGVLVISR